MYIKSESTQSKAREEDVSLWSRVLPLLAHSPDPNILVCQHSAREAVCSVLEHSASPSPVPGHCTDPAHGSAFPQEPHGLHSGVSSAQGCFSG